jgi:CubicO group peptidase (beta-lactamase class C family)
MRILFTFILLTMASYSAVAQIPEAIDSIFQSYFKKAEPGGAVLIAKGEKLIYKNGFGVADIVTRSNINTETLFNLGSISKTFVAYGILMLAAENRLSLEDNLDKYFPDFRNKEIAKKVRIYHLLTHTSGIPDNRNVSAQKEFYLTAKDEENFEPLKQTDTLAFEPGTKYRYSNPAFNGLALIIQQVSGMKWQDFISQRIFQPAGMTHSTITDGPHPLSGVSHAYVGDTKTGFTELDYGEEPTFAAAGNGGVWSSVEELWKYEKALREYKFLPLEWIGLSRTRYEFPSWKDEMPSRLGLSWFLTSEKNVEIHGHTGSQGGFISDYCWLPEHGIFYVLLCNTPKPIGEIRTKLFELLKYHHWLRD